MSGTPKRSFTSFVRSAAVPSAPAAEPAQPESPPELRTPEAEAKPDPREGQGPEESNRTRMITSTGRVRTYTASRNLPGVTLRMTESRWERLKLLSIQERRPIQEILGEAMADFMRSRGLPW
jgi:hypothetical protein